MPNAIGERFLTYVEVRAVRKADELTGRNEAAKVIILHQQSAAITADHHQLDRFVTFVNRSQIRPGCRMVNASPAADRGGWADARIQSDSGCGALEHVHSRCGNPIVIIFEQCGPVTFIHVEVWRRLVIAPLMIVHLYGLS
ncbi:MAG: hypothetical protein ACUVS2_14535 [Candidatus Flexifilum sp.]